METIGSEGIFFFQEYTRGNSMLEVAGKTFHVLVHGDERKRLAFALPNFMAASIQRHYFSEQTAFFYGIEFEDYACFNVHFRREGTEALERKLHELARCLSKLQGKPLIIAGDLNSTFGYPSAPHIGPHCGTPRQTSALFSHFIHAMSLNVVNSWFDIGHTRRPPISKPSDQPSSLDWICIRDLPVDFCMSLWPVDLQGSANIRSDHALLHAGTSRNFRPPSNHRCIPEAARLRSWTPPSDSFARKVFETNTLQPQAWTWHSAADPLFPREAIIQPLNVCPHSEELVDTLDILASIALDHQLNMRLDLWDSESFAKHLLQVSDVVSMRHPAKCLRAIFPHIMFDQCTPAAITPVIRLLRQSKKHYASDQLLDKRCRAFIIRMEKFVLRAKRRRQLASSTSFESVMQQHQRTQRCTPMQCLLDDQGALVQPIDAPGLQLAYYQSVYDVPPLFDFPVVEDMPLSREHLLQLSAAAASTKHKGGLSVGPDGLTSELLRDLRGQQRDELVALAASTHVRRPTSWTNIPVAILPKPFARTIYQNRLISLQAASHKLYLSALRLVIFRDIQSSLDPLMGGIKSGDFVGAWIARLNVVVSKAQEWGIPAFLGFVDISRAFASVDHAYLLESCSNLGVSSVWLRLLHREPMETNIDLHIRGQLVGSISMSRGLVEGTPPSSLLLGIFMTHVWNQLRHTQTYREQCLILPNDFGATSVCVHSAGWVDDWVLLSGSRNGLQTLLTLFSNALSKVGMQLALDKTAWLAIGTEILPCVLHLGGHELKRSEQVAYLGALISAGGALSHLEFRYHKMLAKWGKLKRVLQRSGASKAIFLKAAATVALPSLVWALETHPITGNILIKLQSFVLVVMRSLFNQCNFHHRDSWILMHSQIRTWFRDGQIISPACLLYKKQEKLHLFLCERPRFDLNNIMDWRCCSWLEGKSRRTRPVGRLSGTPPRPLELEFLHRDKYSLEFRALQYAKRHDVLPFG